MIDKKSPAEIDAMAKAGEIHVRTMDLLASEIRPGITTAELDQAAERFIRSQGATSPFKGYRGFPGSICTSPNHMVVHGIPGKFKLSKGDILSVDVGVVYDGWVADGARTFAVGQITPVAQKLLEVTEQSLFDAVASAARATAIGDVSNAVQTTVEAGGFSVVRSLVGHGVGRQMHEEPQIPNYGPAGKGLVLEPGMVLAIEPMVNAGRHTVRMGDDGWAIYSRTARSPRTAVHGRRDRGGPADPEPLARVAGRSNCRGQLRRRVARSSGAPLVRGDAPAFVRGGLLRVRSGQAGRSLENEPTPQRRPMSMGRRRDRGRGVEGLVVSSRQHPGGGAGVTGPGDAHAAATPGRNERGALRWVKLGLLSAGTVWRLHHGRAPAGWEPSPRGRNRARRACTSVDRTRQRSDGERRRARPRVSRRSGRAPDPPRRLGAILAGRAGVREVSAWTTRPGDRSGGRHGRRERPRRITTEGTMKVRPSVTPMCGVQDHPQARAGPRDLPEPASQAASRVGTTRLGSRGQHPPQQACRDRPHVHSTGSSRPTSNSMLAPLGIVRHTYVHDLTEDEVSKLRDLLDRDYVVRVTCGASAPRRSSASWTSAATAASGTAAASRSPAGREENARTRKGPKRMSVAGKKKAGKR